jgi:hypothetical protein
MSQRGLICFNRLVYTKGKEELRDLLEDYKECRQIQNAGPLKTFTSDCLNIDGGLWKETFNDELTDNVVPYRGAASNLPLLGIDMGGFEYLHTADEMKRVALAVMETFGNDERVVYGLDTECCWGENDVRLIQVSFPNLNGVDHKVLLFDLNAAGIRTPGQFPDKLRQMLLMKNFIPTGRAIGTDCSRLRESYGVNINCWIELRGLALQLDPALQRTGLSDLSERFLSGSLDKEGQRADYSVNPLPLYLQQYAALDALVSRLIFEKISSQLLLPHKDVIYEGPDTRDLDESVKVDLYLGGKSVARCSIVYVAQRGSDETRKWGTTSVNTGQVIVRIDEVYHQNVHPPISFKGNTEEMPSWKKENITLDDLVGNDILVRTSNLIIFIDGGGASFIESQHLQRHAFPRDAEEGEMEAGDAENQAQEIEQPEDPFLTFADDLVDESDGDHFRSRSKEDIFHQFQNCPISKLEPLRPVVSRMLIHATFIFHNDDFIKIEEYLKTSKGFNESDPKYYEKIMKDFYHNREWWRARCRMYIANADEHGDRLKRILDVMEKDPELIKLLTPELQLYFENFIKKALRGEFEEQNDVLLFIKNGEDSHGLPLYYRLRGTVRTENVHQKMKTALGPWAVGARTGHMMLTLTCYRYNVKSGIRRCGAHDFGHCELHLIDRIQDRMQEIFNILVWPMHKNFSHFRGKPDFVSVGIGPLSYDEQYVTLSDYPHPNLRGDLFFMAKQMQLLYPLLHVGSISEIRIFTEFMLENRPTMANFKLLAKAFKDKANGIDIFPKLPSMLKSYYNQWEKNCGIKTAEKSLIPDVDALLRDFFNTRISDKFDVVPPTDSVHADQGYDIDIADAMHVGQEQDAGFEVETPIAESENQDSAVRRMHVAPMQAPTQESYIPCQNSTAPIAANSRRCAWYPECIELAGQCGGTQRAKCRHFQHRKDDESFVAEMLEKKKQLKNDRHRMSMSEQRAEEHEEGGSRKRPHSNDSM